MALTIATNVSSLNTQRWLNVSSSKQGVSLERLSSGYKINSAADDAAGYAISNKLTIKSAAITKAIDNGNQGVAMLQTAASGLQTIADMLTRLKELATEASSDNNTTDRNSLNDERVQLEEQISDIVAGTKYGATALLSGGGTTVGAIGANVTVANGVDSITSNSSAAVGAYTITTSAAAAGHSTVTVTTGVNSQAIDVTIPATGGHTAITFAGVGITVNVNSGLGSTAIAAANGFTVAAGASTATFQFQVGDTNDAENQISATLGGIALEADLGLGTLIGTWTNDEAGRTNALSYLDQIDVAIGVVNTKAAGIGAVQNRIEYQIQNMEATQENTKAAASTIKDVDYASEMSEFTSSQIQTQAGIAMLTQANQLPQQILSLLKQ